MRSLETLAQSASRHMQPMEQQISLERVAEIMWQRGNDTDPAVKAHLAWLALLEDERRYWCDRAEAAIADWRRATARNRREAWSNLMERWLASHLTGHAADRDDHSPAAGSHSSGEVGGVGGRAEVEPVSSAGGTPAA